MKRILITGSNSYIGTSFEKFIKENYSNEYIVDTVDMIDGKWREMSFAGYDSVLHVAGIAHQKETKENAGLYYEVNRDIAVETANKAKSDGVNHFVFFSSMSVYGLDEGVITKETKPNPVSNYGKSKLQAENEIITLNDSGFSVCILRPPMVYGNGCKGNFAKIKKLVEKSPIFPYVKNQRSMIYIDNLSAFVKHCTDQGMSGVYFPQNEEYMSTVELAAGISEALGKKIYFDHIAGLCVRFLRLIHPTAKKAFGSLIYDIEDSRDYCIVSKTDSVRRSTL